VTPELLRFPSPDGRFALFMGWGEERHYDASSTYGWVVDKKMEPAAIIECVSQKILFALKEPGRPEEDRALWSADSKFVAYSHRGDDLTQLRVFSLGADDAVREVNLPYFGEVELEMKPRPRGVHRNAREHLIRDAVLPVRWIDSRTLVVSQELSMSDAQDLIYTRQYLIALAFDAEQKATITKVTKQKQRVTGGPASRRRITK
jgi:hypothetical protein